MKSELLLVALVGIEQAALWWVATRPNPVWFHSLLVLNMVLITLFAEKMMAVFCLTSNVGNVFYASACVVQLLICQVEGEQAATLNIPRTLFALIFVLALALVLGSFPSVVGNEEMSAALRRVLSLSPVVIVASFFAFIASQVVLIKTFDWKPARRLFWRFTLAAIACQVVDSLIFFPLAFQSLHLDLLKVTGSGIALKVGVMLGFYPLAWYCSRPKIELAVELKRN